MFPETLTKYGIEPQRSLVCKLIYFAALIWIFSFFSGCASGLIQDARNEFYNGRFLKAANILSSEEHVPKRDKLLFYMEKGLILNRSGRYQESISALLNASNLIEKQDIINISQQAGSIITTEWITEYKGEYCERLWVHTYLIMNYLLLYKYEDALVEVKQALKILKKFPEPLAGDFFTMAIMALCYENLHEINDAYIEYKKLAKLLPDPSPVAFHLYRLGLKLGFNSEADQYKKFIPKDMIPLLNKEVKSELILFIGMGNAPTKTPGNIFIPPSHRFSFPTYSKDSHNPAKVMIFDSTSRLPAISITTNIGDVERASLKDRAAGIILKKTAGIAVKETIAEALEKNDEAELSDVLRLLFFIMEEPDTRCWQTLPASLSLLRVPLEPGKKEIRIVIYGKGRKVIKEIILPGFDVIPGRKFFYSIREAKNDFIIYQRGDKLNRKI